MISDYAISDLKHVPQFLPLCADRIWNAWWKPAGYPLDFIRGLCQENLSHNSLPTAFVAHRGDTFLGTVSLIASDMESRPQYSPWVAALWVDEQYRSSGIASALMEKAKQSAFQSGLSPIYLCATADKDDYYSQRGWLLIEQDINGLNIYHQQGI